MRKNNTFLIAVLVVLAIVVAYFILTRNESTLRKELSSFAVEDTAAVDKIFIADKLGRSSLLIRKGPAEWEVNGKYIARQDAVRNLLITLAKMKVKAPVAKSMEENVLKDLSGPNQKKVEVYAGGRLLKTIYVGIETLDKMGTFMMLEGSSVPFEVHIQGHRGFLQTRFITDERMWRDQTVFGYDERDIRQVTIKYNETPANSFTITSDGTGVPVLSGPAVKSQPADTMLLRRYLLEYRRVVYEYMVTTETFPQETRDSILSSRPWVEITVKDKNGKENRLKGYHRGTPSDQQEIDGQLPEYDPDRMYALLNDTDFVLVQFFQFDRILKTADYFIKP